MHQPDRSVAGLTSTSPCEGSLSEPPPGEQRDEGGIHQKGHRVLSPKYYSGHGAEHAEIGAA